MERDIVMGSKFEHGVANEDGGLEMIDTKEKKREEKTRWEHVTYMTLGVQALSVHM